MMTIDYQHEEEWDLSETCRLHPSVRVVSRCGRFDAPCSVCEAEMEEAYYEDCRKDYKRIASAACRDHAYRGLTPARFNRLAQEAIGDSYPSPDAWVKAAREVAEAYQETEASD